MLGPLKYFSVMSNYGRNGAVENFICFLAGGFLFGQKYNLIMWPEYMDFVFVPHMGTTLEIIVSVSQLVCECVSGHLTNLTFN